MAEAAMAEAEVAEVEAAKAEVAAARWRKAVFAAQGRGLSVVSSSTGPAMGFMSRTAAAVATAAAIRRLLGRTARRLLYSCRTRSVFLWLTRRRGISCNLNRGLFRSSAPACTECEPTRCPRPSRGEQGEVA